jgi:hypothetical protein
MAPAVGELCVVNVSRLASIPGSLDGYCGFCLMYVFSSFLSVFVLGIYIHSLNFYCIVSYYLLLTKPDLRSTHSLFSVTTTRKENSVFSTTCFDLLKSLSSAVCHTINVTDRVQQRQTLVMLPCIVTNNR